MNDKTPLIEPQAPSVTIDEFMVKFYGCTHKEYLDGMHTRDAHIQMAGLIGRYAAYVVGDEYARVNKLGLYADTAEGLAP